jgi:mannose-6-phosphate isomerase-like protein (cupin superfamily)
MVILMKNCCTSQMDHGAMPYVANVGQLATENPNFRTALWTGCHLQMTLMSIPPRGEIGLEVHPDTDQVIAVEQGIAVVEMGRCRNRMEFVQEICPGDTVFVPAGTWHNVRNTGKMPLKVTSIYAPPHHPWGTVQRTRAEAEAESDY